MSIFYLFKNENHGKISKILKRKCDTLFYLFTYSFITSFAQTSFLCWCVRGRGYPLMLGFKGHELLEKLSRNGLNGVKTISFSANLMKSTRTLSLYSRKVLEQAWNNYWALFVFICFFCIILYKCHFFKIDRAILTEKLS